MSKLKVVKLKDLITEIDECINKRIPFSYLRMGDGGIKFIHALLNNDKDQLKQIEEKEGIPIEIMTDVLNAWSYFLTKANYIDTPQVYYTKEFWPRCRKKFKPMSGKTDKRLRMWRELYDYAEFNNVSYCNPEINFLLCLRLENQKNILDILKNKKIAFITAQPKVKNKLKNYNIDIVEIVGHYENHYKSSFDYVIKFIESNVRKYDVFLVSAGELGRIYSGLIKHLGGIAFDMGFIAEYWYDNELPDRLRMFMKPNSTNKLELKLTEEGMKYRSFL